MAVDDISRRRGRSLPHWSRPCGTYFLTFRTHDAIPYEVATKLREDYEFDLRLLQRELGRSPNREEARAARTERYRRAEKYLEQGHGECLLRDPRAARIADEAIRFFDGDRYDLHAWCLMPNHAHVVLTVLGAYKPTGIMGAWKSYSAKEINKALSRRGDVWQDEGFDHLVRGPHSFRRLCRYVWDNPQKLGYWPWVGGSGKLPEGWE
ncbi:hypothetical protein EON82_18390 [bacterium]|nr:MAG: hypothetical protein EON82_18390 [bacterium]